MIVALLLAASAAAQNIRAQDLRAVVKDSVRVGSAVRLAERSLERQLASQRWAGKPLRADRGLAATILKLRLRNASALLCEGQTCRKFPDAKRLNEAAEGLASSLDSEISELKDVHDWGCGVADPLERLADKATRDLAQSGPVDAQAKGLPRVPAPGNDEKPYLAGAEARYNGPVRKDRRLDKELTEAHEHLTASFVDALFAGKSASPDSIAIGRELSARREKKGLPKESSEALTLRVKHAKEHVADYLLSLPKRSPWDCRMDERLDEVLAKDVGS